MQTLRRYVLLIATAALALAGSLSLPFESVLALTPTPTPTAPADQITTFPAPNGNWTAMVNQTDGSLTLKQAGGSAKTTVFPAGSTVGAATWSPDSRRLLVVRNNWLYNQPLGSGATASGAIEIWQVEIQNGQPTPPAMLYQSPTAPEQGPQQIVFGSWSPDNRHLLFWEGILSASVLADGITPHLLEITTGQATPLANSALLNPGYHSWAPDGAALAMTVGGGRSAQTNKWLNLYRLDSSQVTTVVTETDRTPGVVAWSPRGDLIAYAAVPAEQSGPEWADSSSWDNPAIAARRIYLLDPTSGQSRRLNDSDAFQDAPHWSEDGSRLYYARRAGDQLQLMAADPASGAAQPVEGAALPLPDYVGYYGQWAHESLFEQLPAGQAGMQPVPEATPTATPVPPPGAEDQAILEFIFDRHPPDLGALTAEFRQRLAAGQFTDYTRQDIDLTGDGRPEILVTGWADTFYLFAAVLRRDSRGALQELFHTTNSEGKYLGEVRAAVEAQRLILDFLTATGGTGVLLTTWEQRWVECGPARCIETLRVPLISAERVAAWQLQYQYAVSQVSQPDDLTVEISGDRYGWLIPQMLAETITPQAARRFAGPETHTTYRRAAPGAPFQIDRRTETAPGLELAGEFSLQTEETNRLVNDALWQAFVQPDGSLDTVAFNRHLTETWNLPGPEQPADPLWGLARVTADVAAHNGSPEQLGDRVAMLIGASGAMRCRLAAQRHAAGQLRLIDRLELSCTVDFTRLAWADVTGDGQDELLLQTIPPEGNVLAERLTVYGLDNGRLTAIGQIEGAINGPDGDGVFWQDSAAGFTVFAGLPQLEPDAVQTFDDIRLERAFQTYVWDEENGGFAENN